MSMNEFYDYLDTLSPEEQEMALYDFGQMGASDLPGAFAGGYAPEMSEFDYALSSGFGQGAPPELNKSGDVIPWGLDQEAQMATLQKNRNALMADMVTGLMAGPGSWDPSAFTPTTMPLGNPLQTPGRNRAQAYAGRGGYEGFLVDEMLNGATPSEAEAALWDFIAKPAPEDELSPEALQAQQDVIASLPARVSDQIIPGQTPGEIDYTTPQGRAGGLDLGRISEFSSKIFDELATDPTIGYTDPTTGLGYAGSREMPTEAAEWFTKRGFPLPTASYSDETYLTPESDDELMRRMDEQDLAQFGIEDAIGRERGARENEAAITKAAALPSRANSPALRIGAALTGKELGPTSSDRPFVNYNPMTQDVQMLSQEGGRVGRANAVKQARGQNAIEDVINFNFSGPRREVRQVEDEDVGRVKARTKGEKGRRQRAFTRQADVVNNRSSPGGVRRAESIGRAVAMQMQGRNPLQDAIAQRLMGTRAGGLYGG